MNYFRFFRRNNEGDPNEKKSSEAIPETYGTLETAEAFRKTRTQIDSLVTIIRRTQQEKSWQYFSSKEGRLYLAGVCEQVKLTLGQLRIFFEISPELTRNIPSLIQNMTELHERAQIMSDFGLNIAAVPTALDHILTDALKVQNGFEQLERYLPKQP